MSVGVVLTQQDLEAIRKLFMTHWGATIANWKERNVDTCMWIVTCPNAQGVWTTRTGISLERTIGHIL